MPKRRLALFAPAFGPRTVARALTQALAQGFARDGFWVRPDLEVAVLCPTRPESRADAEQLGRLHGQAVSTDLESIAERKGFVEGLILVADTDSVSGLDAPGAGAWDAALVRLIGALNRVGRPLPVFAVPSLGTLPTTMLCLEYGQKWRSPIATAGLVGVAPRLPALDLTPHNKFTQAVLVAPAGAKDLGGTVIDALLAVTEAPGPPRPLKSLQFLSGAAVFAAAEDGRWPRRLLAAALSRCDDIKGLSVDDGRTQDLMIDNMVARLASQPGACLIHHDHGFQATVVLLAGAVGTHTLALGGPRGVVASTQFLIPFSPSLATAAPLAARLVDFFTALRTSTDRALRVAQILEAAARSQQEAGIMVSIPSKK